MFVPPIHDFRAIDVAQPAPARKMPEPEVTHGRMGHDAAIGAVGGPAQGHGGGGGSREGGEGERDQAVADVLAHGGVPGDPNGRITAKLDRGSCAGEEVAGTAACCGPGPAGSVRGDLDGCSGNGGSLRPRLIYIVAAFRCGTSKFNGKE